MHHRVQRSAVVLFLACLMAATFGAFDAKAQAPASAATVFEGARLITGDDIPPIEGSAFLVEGTKFIRVGRRGQ